MPRQLTLAVGAAFLGQHVRYLEFYEMDFGSGILRVTNALYDQSWNGYMWTGWGAIGARSILEESGGFSAPQVSLTLSGIPTEAVRIALGEQYRNRPARIWIAPLDENDVPITDPAGPWLYRMDAMPVTLGETASIALTLSTREESWDRASNERYSHQHQQSRFPGDRGLEYIDQQSQGETVWGAVPVPSAPAPGAGAQPQTQYTNPYAPNYDPSRGEPTQSTNPYNPHYDPSRGQATQSTNPYNQNYR